MAESTIGGAAAAETLDRGRDQERSFRGPDRLRTGPAERVGDEEPEHPIGLDAR